jgi:hypothetical protein
MIVPEWIAPFRARVLRWLILGEPAPPLTETRAAAVQWLRSKRIVTLRGERWLLTAYGTRITTPPAKPEPETQRRPRPIAYLAEQSAERSRARSNARIDRAQAVQRVKRLASHETLPNFKEG